MLKRALLFALLLFTSVQAEAEGYGDVYYNPAEPGWGVFLIQSDVTQFAAFFIYGPDGKPTWYTAQLTEDANGNYNGPLYAITGTYLPTRGRATTSLPSARRRSSRPTPTTPRCGMR